MFIFKILFFAWDLYTLALLVNFLLPYFVKEQKPWMKMLADICAPAVNIGNAVAKSIFGKKEFKFDIGSVVAIVLCIVVGSVASSIVF